MSSQNGNNEEQFGTSREFGLEILLPELESGKEMQLSGNFKPKYIFELVSKMSEDPSEISGYLNLWLLIPRKFIDRPDSISSLVEVVHKNAETVAEAIDFIEDCLFLIENQVLGFNVGFYKSDAPKTASAQAVVFDRADLEHYFAISDTKPGFIDEDIKVFRAGEIEEFVDARNIFNRILALSNDNDARIDMYKGGEVIGWLGFASDWALEEAWNLGDSEEGSIDEELDGVDVEDNDDDDDDIESIVFANDDEKDSKFDILDRNKIQIYDSVKKYLLELDEFKSEDNYFYEKIDEDEREALDFIKYCDTVYGRVELDYSDFEGMHHIPPIYYEGPRPSAGNTAVCICGTLFIRDHGCYQIAW